MGNGCAWNLTLFTREDTQENRELFKRAFRDLKTDDGEVIVTKFMIFYEKEKVYKPDTCREVNAHYHVLVFTVFPVQAPLLNSRVREFNGTRSTTNMRQADKVWIPFLRASAKKNGTAVYEWPEGTAENTASNVAMPKERSNKVTVPEKKSKKVTVPEKKPKKVTVPEEDTEEAGGSAPKKSYYITVTTENTEASNHVNCI